MNGFISGFVIDAKLSALGDPLTFATITGSNDAIASLTTTNVDTTHCSEVGQVQS